MKRRQFTEEFKQRCVKRFRDGEKARVLIDELKVHDSTFYAWVKAYSKKPKKHAKKLNGVRHDALIYLRHARDAMTAHPERAIDDDVYLFTNLALRAMENRT